ncbi:MAG: PEP/pyruvate-binding domain-containing protein [bacterium]
MAEKIVVTSRLAIFAEVGCEQGEAEITLRIQGTARPLLHWGLVRSLHGPWEAPPASSWPEGTKAFGRGALQTPFARGNGEEPHVRIRLAGTSGFSALAFALFFPEEDRWENNHGKNYHLALPGPQGPLQAAEQEIGGVAREIIQREMSRSSWTLMHRYNLCYDLLDRVRGSIEGLALLFVWMRFSAMRQIDWQRNYNTQPRELAHAMDRLTGKLAGLHQGIDPEGRALVRLALTTIGRGGEGQRIRDEILEIMHRHHLKEVSGSFLEEWHQKMHNNSTPDDIVICEAYLAFLRSDGDPGRFYGTLEAAGVSRARLESFERPLKTPPDFVPHLKGALIHDFEHFLGTLKRVHSSVDLGIAIEAARGSLDERMNRLADFIWHRRDASPADLAVLLGKVTELRRSLQDRLRNGAAGAAAGRDLLLLDLALEAFFRSALEGRLHEGLGGDALVALTHMALENRLFWDEGEELLLAWRDWGRLMGGARCTREWALHADSVLDRVERAVALAADRCRQLLQPKAELLGRAFEADPWTIELFSEEVVRGSLLFALSLLTRHLRPLLRSTARVGSWQVISRGSGPGRGRVVAVRSLASVQAERFDPPAVIVADRVGGQEEIPQGAVAILTADRIDVLSHIAIRARNAGVLFAACYEEGPIARLRALAGRAVSIAATASGDPEWEERADAGQWPTAPAADRPAPAAPRTAEAAAGRPAFRGYALEAKDFTHEVVGGKSLNLARLAGRLPDWIRLPVSAAIPFGVMEAVLEAPVNRERLTHCEDLLARLEPEPETVLPELRATLLALDAPEGFFDSLGRVMEASGLEWPGAWGPVWSCIKRVWASKWNERAHWSRRARGIPHRAVSMAVLVQQVVEADYAFVIHTTDPFSGKEDELYAEVVAGLGEALVGNFPGRALGFRFRKEGGKPHVLSYPSKSIALHGRGLIFRSDSSGEDLAGYAGAGLYDSVLLEPARQELVDYAQDPLVWDERFRDELLSAIARIGILLESAFGSPQDVEGAYAGGRYYVVQSRPQVGIHDG